MARVLGARAIDRLDQLRDRNLAAVAALQRVDQALAQRVGSAAELFRNLRGHTSFLHLNLRRKEISLSFFLAGNRRLVGQNERALSLPESHTRRISAPSCNSWQGDAILSL